MSSHRFPAPAPRQGRNTPTAQPENKEGGTAAKPGANAPERAHSPAPAPKKPRSGNSPARPGRTGRRPPERVRETVSEQADIISNIPDSATRENDRENEGFLQPGIKPVTELLQKTPEKIDAVFVLKGRKGKDTSLILDLCREKGVRFSLVDDAFLDRLWRGRHQGAIARLFATGFTELADLLKLAVDAPLPLIVALDQVQDPGNAGALARTLYALGGAGLIVPRHNGVYLGAAAARVAAGALDKLPVAKAANLAQALDEALDAGYTVYGADSASPEPGVIAENVFAMTPRLPAVLVLGGEEGGLRPIIRKRCTTLLSIPFAREFDSLNVAQAGAVIIGAFASSHRASGE